MSLKLKVKMVLFRFLELLPKNQGDWIYHRFQNFFSKESLNDKINSSNNTFRTFEKITSENGIEIRDKIILEIGSGWLPLMPYYFKYLGGAERIETFDLNRHYQQKNIENLNKEFSRKFKVRIKKDNTSPYSLPEPIKYYPNTNLKDYELSGFDMVFSRFVLEHVEPEAIKTMHDYFKRKLKAGAYIIHMISPGDHRAYEDKKLSLQDFLCYSQEEWSKKQTRFDYHNRLRLPQYLEIFKNLGFEVVDLSYEVPDKESQYYSKFKCLNLHEDFKRFNEEELLAGAINIILRV